MSELDYKGEASIKYIKSEINNGLSGNWSYNAMMGYYRKRAYKYVVEECIRDIEMSNVDDKF